MNFDAVKNTLVQEAKNAGLDSYEVYFMESDEIAAETLKGEVSSFSSATSGGICFRCVVDEKMGSASTELFTEQEMKELVMRAVNNAKHIESDDKAVIYEGAKSYTTPSLPTPESQSAAELKELSLKLLDMTKKESEYIVDSSQTGGARYNIRMDLINSHGLQLSNKVGTGYMFVQVVVEKDGESQYGFGITQKLDAEEIERMPAAATKEALAKVGAKEIPSGKYNVIFRNRQMRELLSAYSSVFSGRQANLGLSLFKGKEGETVAAPCITIVDDPLYPQSPMQTGFDGEGVATYTKNVIENGVLKTLLYDIASADKIQKSSTGNGLRSSYASPVTVAPFHFYIAPGTKSEEELLSEMGDGIYITEIKGLHAGTNAVTGDFSIESAGFEVKDGKLGAAVSTFTVAGNFFEMLKSIENISDDLYFGIISGFTAFGAPAVLVKNMSIAGK